MAIMATWSCPWLAAITPNMAAVERPDDRRQPVHAVDEIQGVDAADQPKDRQRNAQPTQFDRVAEGDDAVDVVADSTIGSTERICRASFTARGG